MTARRPLKPHHGDRVAQLAGQADFAKLVAVIDAWDARGMDVAGLPFRVLDHVLGMAADPDWAALGPLGGYGVGGQPILFAAILDDLRARSTHHLEACVADPDLHPMTRFEAMGWACFLRHRAALPHSGPPVCDIVQFWDANPPDDVAAGVQRWQGLGVPHHCYSDQEAASYIAAHFGASAARDYSALGHPALKSDVFRLYRLAQDGGLYVDADSTPGFATPTFVDHGGGAVWASAMTNRPQCAVINGFMAAPQGDPQIASLLDAVLANLRAPGGRGVFWLSGPGAMTTWLYKQGAPTTLSILPQSALRAGVFRQFDAPYKQTEQNWRVFEARRGMTNDNGLAAALSAALD